MLHANSCKCLKNIDRFVYFNCCQEYEYLSKHQSSYSGLETEKIPITIKTSLSGHKCTTLNIRGRHLYVLLDCNLQKKLQSK